MLYRISVTERGLTGIANIFRSRLSRLDDLLGAGTVPLNRWGNIILAKIGLCVDYTALPSKPLGQYRQNIYSRKAHSILSDTHALFINFGKEKR